MFWYEVGEGMLGIVFFKGIGLGSGGDVRDRSKIEVRGDFGG